MAGLMPTDPLGFIFFVLIAFSEILYLLGGIKELIAQIDSDESSL
jgi:hypothetical protein